MKKIHNYIMLLAVALAFAGCADDEIVNNRVQAQTGDDVQFGLSLERLSRTVYGDEETGTDENNQVTKSFPIYWVDGDKVLIFSPDCLEGRKDAEYKVVLPDDGNAYYAKDLVKTSANGVQWGDAETATFYSLYPSGLYGLSDDGTVAKGIFINYNQNILVDGTSIKSDMEDCLMYAKTTANKGDVVNLQYNPIATVFMLTLSADANSAEDFVVQSVSIKSADKSADEKTYIAGSFGINVDGATFAEWGDNKDNIVSAAIKDKATGGYFTLKKGNSIQIPLFMAPVSGLNTAGWKIGVKTLVNGVPQTFIKTLDDRDVQAGKIHKVILPKLSIEKAVEEKDWDPATWMVNIPRNVYLSEVSIPGSWNSVNGDSQGKTDGYVNISTQYKKGIRAFHFDTRWKRSGSSNNYVYTLGIANGGGTANMSGLSSGKVMTDTNNPTFEDALDEIIENLSVEEYLVVVCSFAQDSYEPASVQKWYEAISDICSSRDAVYDAKLITSNTVIGEVLGKVIVMISFDGDVTSIPAGSKCLFMGNNSMEVTANKFPSTLTNDLSGPLYKIDANSAVVETGISMYRSHSQICCNVDTYSAEYPDRNDVDSRGFMPTYNERKTVADNILNWSKNNYGKDDYVHNKWIYLGLGGYHFNLNYHNIVVAKWWSIDVDNNSHDDVASYFNTWINGKVTEMGTTPAGQTAKVPYYPVGIVLMNYVNDYASVLKNILLLNNKYQLSYDPNKSPDYNPNAKQAREYNAVMLNGGAVFQ